MSSPASSLFLRTFLPTSYLLDTKNHAKNQFNSLISTDGDISLNMIAEN